MKSNYIKELEKKLQEAKEKEEKRLATIHNKVMLPIIKKLFNDEIFFNEFVKLLKENDLNSSLNLLLKNYDFEKKV